MLDFLTEGIGIWIVAGLTWLIIMAGVMQFSRFCTRYMIGRKTLDTQLLGLAGQLKRLQTTMGELLVEQRKTTQAIDQLVELKQAEMTGDFSIVEEPQTPEAPEMPPPAGHLPEIK